MADVAYVIYAIRLQSIIWYFIDTHITTSTEAISTFCHVIKHMLLSSQLSGSTKITDVDSVSKSCESIVMIGIRILTVAYLTGVLTTLCSSTMFILFLLFTMSISIMWPRPRR